MNRLVQEIGITLIFTVEKRKEKEVITCGMGKNVIFVGTAWFAANT